MSVYMSGSPVLRARSVTPGSARLSDYMPRIHDHNISNHLNRSANALGHAKTYFNHAMKSLVSRYSKNDWENSNNTIYHLSEKERKLAERLRSDAFQAIKATDQRTRNRQSSNTKRLGERIQDIMFWKEELHKEMQEMDSETDRLQTHKTILEKALADTKNPLAITEECLLQREKRQGIDQVHDNVEKTLSREVDAIKKCQERMRRTIEKAAIQLKMNRAAQHACDKDAKDKFHAQTLDDRMHQLRNSSGGLGFHPGIENLDNTMTIPYSWVKFTQENIARSQRERENSERLRGEIDSLLRACANDMWSNFNSVNNAFNTRIQETNDAKAKLQANLQWTSNAIRKMECSIEDLRKAIHAKELPMKVAQTRLNERTHRINVELCNDPVMKGLQTEVNEIRESVRILKEKLRQEENSLVGLLKARAALQHDISVKENSLMIDSKYCLGMRNNMPMDPQLSPIFKMSFNSM